MFQEQLQHLYNHSLPIAAHRSEIIQAIRSNQVIIAAGGTGCGKTTQLPLMCMEARGEKAGMICVAQPRRIAAISIANYIASIMPKPYKNLVSYKVRFFGNDHTGTKILFVTDGIILAETAGDRLLSKYETIIIDEAHERNLAIDFCIGYCRKLLLRRPELKLIIASATMDTRLYSRCFKSAPVINVNGRNFPVEIRYEPPIGLWRGFAMRPCADGVIHAVQSIVNSKIGGDVLVFLPTVDDIHECHTGLAALLKEHACDIINLYGRMNSREQNAIFQPSANRKIILATNIAETSVTVPNIRFVVDSGLARCVRFDPLAGITRMPVDRISKASADQRAGRCGRVRDGICIRLYSEADFASMPRFSLPEIKRSNLAGVILRMTSLGFGKPSQFPFLQPPSSFALEAAYRQLRFLGALDRFGTLTELGKAMSLLPLDPAIARMVLYAQENDALSEITVIASALSVGDLRTEGTLPHCEEKSAPWGVFSNDDSIKGYVSDFMELVAVWRCLPRAGNGKISRRRLQDFCEKRCLSVQRVREWINVRSQLMRICKRFGNVRQRLPASYERIHKSLLSALAVNVAERGEGGAYCSGGIRDIMVSPSSRLFRTRHDWVLLHDVAETKRSYARYAAVIDTRWILELFPRQCRTTYDEPGFDIETGEVICFRNVSFNGLAIVKNQRTNYFSVEPDAACDIFVKEALIERMAGNIHDFILKNQIVIDKIMCWQRKLRSHSLYRGDALFEFYRSRLPKVASVAQLNACIGRAKNDRFLHVRESDLLTGPFPDDCKNYPDNIVVAGVTLPISYLFEPDAVNDGATATVPLAVFKSVPVFYWEWLLPVYWKQRIVDIVRKNEELFSSNEMDRIVEEVIDSLIPGKGPFLEQVLMALRRILPDLRDIRLLKSVPAHLWLGIAIIDDAGKEMETIRPPIRLPTVSIRQIGMRPPIWEKWCPQWEREDISVWDTCMPFQSVVINSPGQQAPVHGITAFTRENDRVCQRVFINKGAAFGAHRKGVRLLLERSLCDKIAWAWLEFSNSKRISVRLRDRMEVLNVKESLELVFNEIAFDFGHEIPMDKMAFDRMKKKSLLRIDTAGTKTVSLMDAILPEYESCLRFIEKWKSAQSNSSRQIERLKTLEALFHSYAVDFIKPYENVEKLDRLPRYFRGFLHRLQLAVDKPKLYDEYAQILKDFKETAVKVRHFHEANLPDVACKLDEYEEMIEEWAIEMFTRGKVPTRFPVSEQRLRCCKDALIKTLIEYRNIPC